MLSRSYREVLMPRYANRVCVWFLANPRARFVMFVAAVVYAMLFVWATPAMAAGPKNPLSGLDREDSLGYMISHYSIEYQLDLINGALVIEGPSAFLTTFMWELYRWAIGAAAFIIEFALGFEWVGFLSTPLVKGAFELDALLSQFPAVRQLLIVLAVGIGLLRIQLGQGTKGITEIVCSLFAWGISAAVLVNPVGWLTGPEGIVTRATEGGKELSSEMVSGVSEGATLSSVIVDIFIRAPHQFVAYGALADGGGCEATYDDNLGKPAKDLANAMIKCSPDFAETIKHPGPLTVVTMFIILVGALCVIGLAVVGSVIVLYEVANMLVAGLVMVWELFRSVGPGQSYRGLVGVFINLGGSALAMYLTVILTAIYLGIVQRFFDTSDENLIVMFLIIDALLVVGICLLWTKRAQLKKKLEEMKNRTKTNSGGGRGPRQLSFGRIGGSALAGGAAAGIGHRVSNAAMDRGTRLVSATRTAASNAGGAALSPLRAQTRNVTRPGYWKARAASGYASKLTRIPGVPTGVKKAVHHKEERRWEKKQYKKEQRRQDSKHWTWASARKARREREQSAHIPRPTPQPRQGRKRRPQRVRRPFSHR